jgi:hypothetical protein
MAITGVRGAGRMQEHMAELMCERQRSRAVVEVVPVEKTRRAEVRAPHSWDLNRTSGYGVIPDVLSIKVVLDRFV